MRETKKGLIAMSPKGQLVQELEPALLIDRDVSKKECSIYLSNLL